MRKITKFVFIFLCLLFANVAMAQKCTQCGTTLPSNAKFCQECGAKVTVVTTAPVAKKVWFSGINLVPREVVNGACKGLGVHVSFHVEGYKGQELMLGIELFDKDGDCYSADYPNVVPNSDKYVCNDFKVYFNGDCMVRTTAGTKEVPEHETYYVRAFFLSLGGNGDGAILAETNSKLTYLEPKDFCISRSGATPHPPVGKTPAELVNEGCLYYSQGVYANAVSCFRKAAEQGNSYGQANLGLCYYFGNGVSQNYGEAVKWYRMAAEQGNEGGQQNLAICYENGHGVTKDIATAVSWYRKAAAQGNTYAKDRLKALGY